MPGLAPKDETNIVKTKLTPVILDTDIGSDIDDTWALALLLKSPELDLKMVLTDTGDTEYRARLAAKLLKAAGREDVPLGIGIPFDDQQRFQEEWVQDYALSSYRGPVHKQGVQAFVDLVMTSPERMTLIAISAAPNLSTALSLEPRIASKLRFVGMFGSVHKGYEGAPGPVAEANVKYHNAAFQKVYSAFPDLTLTPLDTCGLVKLTGDLYAAVRDCPDPLIRALMENYRLWAKRVPWEKGIDTQARSSTLFDTAAVYLAISEELLEIHELGLRVTDDGQTLVDDEAKKARVALAWKNLDAFHRWLVRRLTGDVK